ncbi:MAG TPA: hypothetical protein VH277_06935, partial [Gemmatimonadaceae bacterium]|nr:hypothetical protein [Gemmatimonadaceae bacterium]
MKLGRAVTIGAVGGALVILIVWLGGIPGRASADLCSLAAGVLFGTTTVTAWVGGLVVQLVV